MSTLKEIVRLKSLNSRFIGAYRLVTEQFSDEHVHENPMIEAVQNTTDTRSFDELTDFIRTEVYNSINSEKAMNKIIKNSTKQHGALTELLFPNISGFSKHTILIRFGAAMETGIRKYLAFKYRNISSELEPLIKGFLDKNVQLDIAIHKDNTYFVSELKYNFNLDTEKTVKTIEKLDLLNITLKKFYKTTGINTNVSLVSLRYPHADDIIHLNQNFKSVKSQYILGYMDFFRYFNINVTEDRWNTFHKNLGDEILQLYSNIIGNGNTLVEYAN